MRIAYLTSEYPAISHTFIRREVEELRRRGVDVQTFSVRPARREGVTTDADERELANTTALLEPPYLTLLRNAIAAALGHPVRFTRTACTAVLLGLAAGSLLRWIAYFFEGVLLGRELKRRNIAHLHNHFANASANVALLASAYAGVPFSFTLHGLPELEWPGVGPLSDKLARANFMTTICDFNRAQVLRKAPPADWGKVYVARCGLELSQFPRRVDVPHQGPIRVLSVARFSKEKGIPGLIEAFDRVLKEGLDAHLILIGDGPERAHIESEIRRRSLTDRVELRGEQAGAAVRDAYIEADIFVLPSLMEGLPIVIMEAMAVGTPVIAPGLAGIPELVVPEQTGLLFAPAKWSDLADKILRLGRDGALRARLADAGRAKVEEEHDIRVAVLPMLELFGVVG